MSDDQDGAGRRTRENRRRKDLLFLESLRWVRYYEDLAMLWRIALEHRRGPKWRQVAILRANEDVLRGGARERLLADDPCSDSPEVDP